MNSRDLPWGLSSPDSPDIDASKLSNITNMLAVWLPSDEGATMINEWDVGTWKAASWIVYWQCALPWFVDRLQATNAAVPPEVWDVLLPVAADSRERTRRMLDASVEFLTALGSEGIAALPFKGAVLAPVYYDDPLRRPLGDLDILIHKTDLSAGIAVLERLGYRFYSQSAEDVVYLRGERQSNMWAADNVHPVELHFTLREEYAGLAYNLADSMWRDTSLQPYWQGSEVWLPEMATLLLHVCAHATSDWLIHRGRLMHLDDILSVSAKMSAPDWATFLKRTGKEDARFIYPILSFVSKYCPQTIPSTVLETLRIEAPSRLVLWCKGTELADTSMSNPASRSGLGLDMAHLLATGPRERLQMWLRSLFPRRWNLTKRYPRLAKSRFWPLCYVLLNLDRAMHMVLKR